MKIVIAEDDRTSALKLSRALEKMGHEVEVVYDGAAAWRRISDGGVGLLISDWEMPETDGPALCRLIRSRSDALYTYIILLTSRDSREDRLAGLQAGADDFLTKPLDTSELVARLNIARRILAMQEQLRAHAAQLAELHAALARQNALLAERAVTDGLTGLHNRRHLDETLRSALSLTERGHQPLSLVLLDIDHFKSYNDTFGHPAGDDVLRAVAAVLQSHARAHDLVARFGGEEFALVLPSTDESGARSVGERLREAIASVPWPLRPVTASFGLETTNGTLPESVHLIAAADRALYASKARGRNRVTHHLDVSSSHPGFCEPPPSPGDAWGYSLVDPESWATG